MKSGVEKIPALNNSQSCPCSLGTNACLYQKVDSPGTSTQDID